MIEIIRVQLCRETTNNLRSFTSFTLLHRYTIVLCVCVCFCECTWVEKRVYLHYQQRHYLHVEQSNKQFLVLVILILADYNYSQRLMIVAALQESDRMTRNRRIGKQGLTHSQPRICRTGSIREKQINVTNEITWSKCKLPIIVFATNISLLCCFVTY